MFIRPCIVTLSVRLSAKYICRDCRRKQKHVESNFTEVLLISCENKYRATILLRFQKPDRKTLLASQTGDYLGFKEDFEKALSTIRADKGREFRSNMDPNTSDNSQSAGN